MPQPQVYVSTVCSNSGDRSLQVILDQYFHLGIHFVEISAPHPPMSFEALSDLIQKYQSCGMNFIFHNYFPAPHKSFVLNMISRNAEVQAQTQGLIKRAVSLALETDVDLYCFHPGYLRDGSEQANGMFQFQGDCQPSREEGLRLFSDHFSAFYDSLRIERRDQKFFIGIENLFPSPSGEDISIFCDAAEVDRLFDQRFFHNSNIGILIDLAHLKIASNLYGFDRDQYLDRVIKNHGDRIYEIHLSSNDGKHDLHEPVREGSWELQALKRFRGCGTRLNGGASKICIESRKMSDRNLLNSIDLVRSQL